MNACVTPGAEVCAVTEKQSETVKLWQITKIQSSKEEHAQLVPKFPRILALKQTCIPDVNTRGVVMEHWPWHIHLLADQICYLSSPAFVTCVRAAQTQRALSRNADQLLQAVEILVTSDICGEKGVNEH